MYDMSWYKKSQRVPPISISSYSSQYVQLNISFADNPQKIYTYYKVSPHIYEKIEKLLRFKNYPEVANILNRLSVLSKREEV